MRQSYIAQQLVTPPFPQLHSQRNKQRQAHITYFHPVLIPTHTFLIFLPGMCFQLLFVYHICPDFIFNQRFNLNNPQYFNAPLRAPFTADSELCPYCYLWTCLHMQVSLTLPSYFQDLGQYAKDIISKKACNGFSESYSKRPETLTAFFDVVNRIHAFI